MVFNYAGQVLKRSLTWADALGSWESAVSKPATSLDDIYLMSDGTSGEPCSEISMFMLFSMLDLRKVC